MSKAQQLSIKVIQGGIIAGSFLAFILFAFTCIGANTSWSEAKSCIIIGLVPMLLSCIPFVIATALRIVLTRQQA